MKDNDGITSAWVIFGTIFLNWKSPSLDSISWLILTTFSISSASSSSANRKSSFIPSIFGGCSFKVVDFEKKFRFVVHRRWTKLHLQQATSRFALTLVPIFVTWLPHWIRNFGTISSNFGMLISQRGFYFPADSCPLRAFLTVTIRWHSLAIFSRIWTKCSAVVTKSCLTPKTTTPNHCQNISPIEKSWWIHRTKVVRQLSK